jgi:hypothetical protein
MARVAASLMLSGVEIGLAGAEHDDGAALALHLLRHPVILRISETPIAEIRCAGRNGVAIE